jgi:hypothetical protein
LAKSTRRTTQIKNFAQMGYPQMLKEKNMEQITNVYNKLIFPGQYIPHIYTEGNRQQIQLCGDHVSEVYRTSSKYTQGMDGCLLQHCRNYGEYLM